MKELFRERDYARVGYYQSLLEEEGIQTHVRNRDLVTGIGTEVPIPEFFPALCVVNEEDYGRAMEFLREFAGDDPPVVDLPHQTKGIVVVGVCAICSILLLYGYALIFTGAFYLPRPNDIALKNIFGAAVTLAGVAGIWRVLSSYRQTKLRERAA